MFYTYVDKVLLMYSLLYTCKLSYPTELIRLRVSPFEYILGGSTERTYT